MGFFDSLNHLWSRADFWNKQENAQQDAAYEAEQERKRRQQQQQQQAQAAADARARQNQQATVTNLFGDNPLAINSDQSAVPRVQQPGNDLLQPKQLPSFQEQVAPTLKNPYTGDVNPNPFAANPATGKMRGFQPQKGQPGYVFTPEGQAEARAQTQAQAHAQAVSEAPKLQSSPYKESFWGKVANFVPILGSQRQKNSLQGVDSGDRIQEDVAIAKNLGLTLDQVNQLAPEQRAQTLNQLHKASNVAKGASVADIAMTAAIPFTLGGSLLGEGAVQGGKAVALATARKMAQDFLSKEGLQRAGVGGGATLAADAAAQQYITGRVDPTQSLRSGLLGAGLGLVDPLAAISGKGKRGIEESLGRPPVSENNMPSLEAPNLSAASVVPEAPEVAPGVKAPNLMKQPREEMPMAPQAEPVMSPARPVTPVEPTSLPTPEPLPVVPRPALLPVEPPTLPSLERPAPRPQGAVPTNVTHSVPTIQTINPEIRKAVEDAAKRVMDTGEQPAVRPQKQTVSPVETKTQAASKEVIATSAPTPPAEVIKAAEKATPETEPTVTKHPDVAFAEKRVQAAQERLDSLKRQGEPTKQAAAELSAAKNDLQTVKVETAHETAIKPTVASPEAAKPDVAQSSPTPVKRRLLTQADKDAHEAARSAAVRKAEAETAAQHAQDVYHEALQNTTKSGKVSARWKRQKLADAGDDAAKLEAVRGAVEKIEGRKAPATVPEEAAGGIAKDGGKGVSKSGDVIDTTSKEAAKTLGKSEAAKTDAVSFIKKMAAKEKGGEGFTQKDAETARELQKKFTPDDQEFHDLGDIDRKSGTQAAQTLATRAEKVRETGSTEDIVNSYINRLRNNTGLRLTSDDVKDIYKKVDVEIKRRSEFNKAQEEYMADPSSADKRQTALDAKAAKDQARKEAIVEEMRTTIKQKGSDQATQQKLYKMVDQLSKKADVWQMDYIDTSLLSSTGTWTNNFINSGLAGVEEALFGRLGATIARKKTGTNIGGGGVFNRQSQRFGLQKLRQDYQVRTGLPAKTAPGKLMNRLKNYITTVNELGNTQIEATAHSSVRAEYRTILKREHPDKYGKGMTADAKQELNQLADYMATVDPRDLRQKYTDAAFNVQGMGSLFGHYGKKSVASFENRVTKGMSQAMQSVRVPKLVADNAAKLTMRAMIGFPSIVARSAVQGGNRLAVGIPTFIRASATQDPVERAMLIKQGVKETGSGIAMWMVGYTAGASGVVTGAYPSDKTTRDEWEKEGKSEHSVKIGDSYYSIPRAFGPFAIPFMVGAQFGQNHKEGDGAFGDFGKNIVGVVENIGAATPVSQINDNINTVDKLMTGEPDTAVKNLEKIAGNMLRVTAPASGLLNEIAQDTVKNEKDTESDSPVEAILNKLYSGLPGLNQHLPDKTAKDGTPIKNTNPLARLAGAQSTENKNAVRADNASKQANNDRVAPIVGDKDIYALLDDDTKNLIAEATNPKRQAKLNDQNYKSIYKAVAKTTGRLASDGKWDAYGKTLQLKLNNQNKDKTVTEEDKATTKRQITQAEIMRDHKIDPQVFAMYHGSGGKGVSESEFKDMLDPDSELYDKTSAERLWQLDQLFTESGVSDNIVGIDPWNRQKYTLAKSGSGSRGKKGIATDFGTLKSVGSSPVSNQAIKAIKLADFNDLVPNLSKRTASTNLKKSIRVKKGVALY